MPNPIGSTHGLSQYRFEDMIGAGGMATVWRATHTRTGDEVAVKVVTLDEGGADNAIEAFRREARAMAQLHHPNVVRIHDYGTLDARGAARVHGQAGAPYLVMELADGGTLDTASIDSWEACRGVALDVLDALAYLHARNLVHRDLKPENILCVSDGHVTRRVLSDFGLAQAFETRLDATTPEISMAEAGTPLYMAPEQLRGDWRNFGPWTDLYQLGCVLYEIVYGEPPFWGDHMVSIALRHLREEPTPGQPRFDVPEALWPLLERLLTKETFERPDRAAIVARSLLEMHASPDSYSPMAETSDAADFYSADTSVLSPDELPFDIVADDTTADTIDTASSQASDWRPTGSSERPISAVGLGLAGLRRPPFVAREEEREQIWASLSAVVEGHGARAVLLQGKSGVGTSRLAGWVTRRAHELGLVEVLRSAYSESGGPNEGLRFMLESHLKLWTLDRPDALERVATILRGIDAQADAPSSAAAIDLDQVAESVVDSVFPPNRDGEQTSHAFVSPIQRYLGLARLFEHQARRRPVLVWIDDVHWGGDALNFVDYMLTRHPSIAIFFVMTARREQLERRPHMLTQLDRMDELGRLDVIEVGPLARDEQRQLVEGLIDLSPRLVDQVVTHTGGRPLHAVQLVGHWLEQDMLEPGTDGFELIVPIDSAIPASLEELWRERLAALVDSSDAEGGVGELLELASALGEHVDEAEWQLAARTAGLEVSGKLVEELVVRNLARRPAPRSWAFAHPYLRGLLEQRARRQDRWAEHNRCCAQALANLYEQPDRSICERRTRHLLAAGLREQALDSLLTCIELDFLIPDYQAAIERLLTRRELMDALGLDEKDRRRAQNLRMEAQAYRALGEPDDAWEALELAIDICERAGFDQELALVGIRVAAMHLDSGAVADAEAWIDRAEAMLDPAGNIWDRLSCKKIRAALRKASGEPLEAARIYDELLAEMPAPTVSPRRLQIYTLAASAWLMAGDLKRARTMAQTGAELADRLSERGGHASLSNMLGEIARLERNWQAARQYYLQAERLAEATGSRFKVVYRLNQAMVDIGARRYQRARQTLAEVEQHMARVGFVAMLLGVELAQAACAAGLGERQTCLKHLAAAEERLDADPPLDSDLPWMAELGADLCRKVGWINATVRLLNISVAVWRRLGRDNEAGRVATKLRNVANAP